MEKKEKKRKSEWNLIFFGRQRQKIYKCFHGFDPGLSPDLQSMEQIRRIMRPTDVPDQGKAMCKSQCAPFMA